MILLQISDGTTTLYLCDIDAKRIGGKENNGYELDGQFYIPGITNQTSINIGLNGNFGSINQSYLRIKRDLVSSLTKDELTATIWLWDEKTTSSKFKVFSGVIGLREKNSNEYTYQIRQNNGNLDADLLTASPDLKTLIGDTSTFVNGRVYPYYFGYLKYIVPLQLATSTSGGVYYSEGEVTKMFDGGQPVQFSQSTTQATKSNAKPVYEITLDIDSSSASAGGDTTSNDSKPYGVVTTINGTQTTATRVEIKGAYISNQASVTSTTRLDYETTEDGQFHQYVWTDPPGVLYDEGWYEIVSLGQSTLLGDTIYIFAGSLEMYLTSDTNLLDIGVASLAKRWGIIARANSGGGGLFGGTTDGDVVLTPRSSAPSTPSQGAIYFDTTLNKFRGYDGTIWNNFH